MADLLRGPDFAALFDTVERSAVRLESRDFYAGDGPVFARWLRHDIEEPPLVGDRVRWLDRVRVTSARGVTWARIRVTAEPLTWYQRFALRSARQNVAAGERVTYLDRVIANRLDLPAHDFWLFDDDRVALLWFTADDRLLGAQVVTAPQIVARHREWIGLALQTASAYEDFLAGDPSREVRPGRTV